MGLAPTGNDHDVWHGARGDAGCHRRRARPARDRQSDRRAARQPAAARERRSRAGAADPRRACASDRHHRLRRRLHPGDVSAVRGHLGRVRTARDPDRRRYRARAEHPDLSCLRQAADVEPSRRTIGATAVIDTFAALAHGMAVALQPMNLLYALIGVFLGTAVGVLPGIGPALTVALLLPVTYKLDPGGSLIMFAGIYYGGMYGGSTTAILINTPGESASMATALEGNKMAKAGRGGPALATAAIGSFVAGTLATIGLAFIAPWLVDIAVRFGPEDYFALMCVAFVTVSATFGDSPIRGLTSLFIGLTLGLVGIDKLTGQPRLAFGVPELLDGVEVTTLAVGLFAVGEALYVASRRHLVEEKLEPVRGSLWMTKEDWQRSWKPWLRGTLFGFPIGALPAGGAEIPTFLSYSTEKRLTKHPEDFGKGAIEGVAGPEAANNASAAGTLGPLLTLGLPTSATAAMMLAGFQQYGLNPGPLLFAEKPDLVWGLIASLFIANGMLLVLNLPLVGVWVRLLAIPQPWLYAGILVFATMGTIAANPSPVELIMLSVFGVLGFLMRRFDFPVAPVVVGLILGPVAESQLRRALSISLGDPMTLVQSPISATLLGVALIALLAPFVLKGLGRFKANED